MNGPTPGRRLRRRPATTPEPEPDPILSDPAVIRTLVVWCSDWPVLALGCGGDEPAAVLVANRVIAATEAARHEGVETGMRRREAQARCPAMKTFERDIDREARTFEAVVVAATSFTPWVEQSWPGSCAFPTRGPSRYFGGDEALMEAVRTKVAAVVASTLAPGADGGTATVRVGVADGLFSARLAARSNSIGSCIEPGGSAAFLAPLPLSVLDQPQLVDVLSRLGMRCLGDFAALRSADVLGRFGREGRRAHRLALGFDEQPLDARPPPEDLSVSTELDPPVERIDQAAFAAKSLADRLSVVLDDAGWSCLRLAVEAETEHGERLLRLWRHEGALSPGAITERVRWQLEGWLGAAPGLQPTGGLIRLALIPDQVIPAGGRQIGFWGEQGETALRAARAAHRVAALLGADAVQVVQRRGGRTPTDQFSLLAATATDLVERAEQPPAPSVPPWPGRLPTPSPAVAWPDEERLEARLVDEKGTSLTVSGRGELSGVPQALTVRGRPSPRPIIAWAGPWPVEERWWDPANQRRAARMQLVLDDGSAWLVVLQGGRWWAGAHYD